MSKAYPPQLHCLLFMLLGLLWASPLLADSPKQVPGEIVNVTPDGVYINVGRLDGLRSGDTGILSQNGQDYAEIEVVLATSHSARLRIIQHLLPMIPTPGDSVIIEASEEKAKAKTEKPRPKNEPKVPLLAPVLTPLKVKAKAARAESIFHGNLRFQTLLQHDPKNSQDSARTSLSSSGNFARINGSPWALDWSAKASSRDGHAYSNLESSLQQTLDIYDLELHSPIGEGSHLGMGRLRTGVLPAIGTVDGFRVHKDLSKKFRIEFVTGFKPDRLNLDFSSREPLVAAISSYKNKINKRSRYSLALGILGSLYEGESDRLAFFLRQNLSYNNFRLLLNSTIDTDIGGAETRSGTRLSQLNVSAHYKVNPALSFRADLSHNERIDTQAERDAYSISDDRVFTRGFWRYSVGSTQRFYSFTFDEQLSFIDAPDSNKEALWFISVNKNGLPGFERASATLNLFNIAGITTEGYGGRLFASLPFSSGQIQLQAGMGFEFLENDVENNELDFTDTFINLHWRHSKNWTSSTRVIHLNGSSAELISLQFSLTYRW